MQGVPANTGTPQPHKYLIGTNPVLTDLKQFLSSDYLLGQLNVNPDQAIKRLGDGLYEQRLIREGVVARTGQRYIDGMTSDETLFRYLMDNAIASKDKLSLSVGVSLSAEQVAALTHDIVWMEQVEVNGEKVLAPVLYLAHANGRVAPNGALIQGRDVNLISGGDLVNVGTLRATNNLAASATNISNSGLIEAGGRLDMLATDSIRNAQGGIIAGREVSLTALTGDVINERSVTRLEGRAGGEHVTKDLVDSAARIEAANDLTVTAGRDIGNVGGVVKAGGNLDMEASRNLSLASQQSLESHEYQRRRVSGYDTTITQYGGEVTAGGSITATAGQDLSVIASEIEARRNLTLSAGNDILLSSAANEEHDYAKGKKGQTKTTTQLDDVRQVGVSLKAGGDIQVEAGNDLKMVASKVSAGEDAYLVAGGKLELLAEYDSHYSLYDMSKKGNWGSSKTQRDEVTDVKAVGSEVSSGGSTSLVSGGDQLYQGAKVEAGSDLAIISGGAVTFEAVKDMHQESHEKSKGDLAWNSAKGRGTTDETLRQNQLVAQGVLTIKAVDGLKIDIKHIDQATVSQSIDAMIVADPKLAWLKEAELRGDVDWRRVKEVHDSFKYDQSGLGAGASLVIAIIVTYLTWGAGASAVGAASNSTLGFAANSVVSAAATNAATSAVNNRGNLGAVVKDVTSSDAMKGYVMSALAPGGDSIVSRIALKAALSTVVYGGSLKDNAVQAGLEIAADALSGAIFNEVGDRLMGSGLPKRVAVHAIVGGLIAEAAGGDFRTAALAAGANEALVQLVGDKIFPGEAHDRVLGMTSQLVGMTVAAGLGADAKDQQVAAWVAQQATQNNFLRHKEVEAFLAELKTCDANNSCADVRKRYGDLNIENQERLERLCARDMDACRSEYKLFSDDYQKTHALLAGSMKEVGWKEQYALGATILSNYQAMQTLVGTAMTKAMTDAAQEAAGQAGVGVDAEDVGTFGMWLRTVVKAVTSRKGAVGGTERGPCCFAAGTLVATPGGDRAIETLKVGDIVWTKPEHGGEPFAAAITATHIRNDQPIYRLTLESTRADGQVQTETLFVTPSHPFYVPARHDFVPMGDLRTGDLLQSLADGAGNDTSSRVASISLHKLVGETFNLSVDVGHTFYVGKLKTWVHNVGPCGESGGIKPGVGDAKGSAAGAAEANNALSAAKGVVASRVNVRTGAANVTGSGLEYAWKKHGGAWGDNKSAFTISKDELKVVLQSPQVVKTPAYQSPTSGNFIRTVDMGRPVGIDAKAGGQSTNFMTVITDSKGNLVNTFPGKTF